MSTVTRALVKVLCCWPLVLLFIQSSVGAQDAAGVPALLIESARRLPTQIVPNSPHTEGIYSVAFSGSGQLLLSGGGNNFGGDYKLRLWNVATGALLRVFVGHTWKVTSVAITADGLTALSGSRDGKAILWDTATGRSLRVFKGEKGSEITSVAFSSDGRRVLVGFEDGKDARVFDARTGALLKTFRGHSAGVTSVAFSADGRRIVTGSRDFTAMLWDVASGKALRVFKGHTSQVTSVAFSPDGRIVVSGEILPDPTIKFWDAMDGRVLATFRGHTSNIESISFSPDGAVVFSADADGLVKQWNVARRVLERSFKLPGTEINALAVSPNGKSLAVAGADLELLNALDGDRIRRFGAETYSASSVAFSPDGTRFVAGGSDAAISLYDARTGNLLRRFLGHSGSINAVVFSPDGRIASGSTDETVKIWDALSGALLLTLTHAPNSTMGGLVGVTSLAFSPDGARIVTGNGDNTVRLWNARSGALLRTLAGHYYSVSAVAFSPDGSRIVSAGGTDETVRVWNAETGASLRKFGKPNPDLDGGPVGGATAALFLPDGIRVLSVTPDPLTIQLWNVKTGRILRTFTGHSAIVSSLAISSDGALALSGSHDRSMKLWNLSTGELVRTFADTSEIDAVAFSPDGRRALSSNHDGALKVWNVQNGELLVTILGGSDWLSITPAGFFSGSEEKAMAVNAIRGFQVF
jgi:WD40 repeat protein